MIELIKEIKVLIRESLRKYSKLEDEFSKTQHDTKNPLRKVSKAEYKKLLNFYKKYGGASSIECVCEKEFQSFSIYSEYINYLKTLNLYKKINSSLFWKYIDDYGINKKELKYELEEYGQSAFQVPKNLMEFLSFSSWVSGEYFGCYLDSFGITSNEVIRDLIASEVFPPVMGRFLVLGSYDEYALGTWLYDEQVEDGEILLFDCEEQKIQIVSNSVKNFIRRGIECYKADVIQDYFEPNETALQIIRDIDGDNVLPNGDYYTLNYTDDWPEHWQVLFSAEDKDQS